MKNAAVDRYIARSQPFARPILAKIRGLFHKAAPDVKETIKWGMPNFERNGIIGFMAAFKSHCGYGVWLVSKGFRRAKTIGDLPSDGELVALVRKAVAKREKGETLFSHRKKRLAVQGKKRTRKQGR